MMARQIWFGFICSASQEGNIEVKHEEGEEAGWGCPVCVQAYKHTRVVSLAPFLQNLLQVDSSRTIFVNAVETLSDMLLLLPNMAAKPHAAGLTVKHLFSYECLGMPE